MPIALIAAGGSAGAHLAIVAALSGPGTLEGNLGETGTSSHVAGVVGFYPPTDLTDIHMKGRLGRRSVAAFLGGHPDQKPDALREATPATHVRPDAPPVYIAHGTIDHVVPYAHAPALADAIRTAGGQCSLRHFPE